MSKIKCERAEANALRIRLRQITVIEASVGHGFTMWMCDSSEAASAAGEGEATLFSPTVCIKDITHGLS